MKKEVIYARLHGTDAFLPEFGPLGSLLPTPNKSVKSFKMFYTPEGLELNVVLLSGRPIEAIIPQANVQIAVYAPEKPVEAVKAS